MKMRMNQTTLQSSELIAPICSQIYSFAQRIINEDHLYIIYVHWKFLLYESGHLSKDH